MPYHRTTEQQQSDFQKSRAYEEHVESCLGVPTITRFNSANDLDIYVPTDVEEGWYLEIKEKNQSYTDGWHLLDGVPERDLFIMDELTMRRAMLKYPNVMFLIRDNAANKDMPRLFMTPIWDLICVDKVRVNRVKKGKWIINLAALPRIADETAIVEFATHAISSQLWLSPMCAGVDDAPQVKSPQVKS